MEWKFVKVQCAWCTSDREAWVYCRADGTFEVRVHGNIVTKSPTNGKGKVLSDPTPCLTLREAKELAMDALKELTKG